MTGMAWYVVRFPETGGVGVVPETSLDHHRQRGWLRVSDAMSAGEKDHIVPESYVDAPDLDAPKPEPTAAPAKSTKEK